MCAGNWRRSGRMRMGLVVALALAATTSAARAQETGEARAIVTQVAGSTLYIDRGTEAGIATGDTVSVARESGGAVVGRLLVVSAASRTAVLAFAESPFAITRGETLYLSSPAIGRAREGAGAEPTPVAPTRTGVSPAARRTGPRVTGHVGLDVDVVQSQTRYGSGEGQTVDRTNATPVLRVQTRVTELPGGFSLDFGARGSYRYSSLSPFDRPTSIRVHSASVEKRFEGAPLEIRAGRFYNRYESFSGFWDGAMVRVGGSRAGVGVLAGFQPDRWNEGFSTDLPKLTAFADFSTRGRGVSYTADVSGHRVAPRNGLPDHTFFGVSQRVRFDRVRLSQDLQVDRDPIEDRWDLTRLHVQASIRVQEAVDLHLGVSRKRPYRLWDSLSVIPYARDRVSGGLDVRAGRVQLGADVALNRDERDGNFGPSLSGRVYAPGLGPLALTGSASYWSGTGYRVLSLMPGLALTTGRARIDARYRYYHSDYDRGSGFLTHSAEGGVSFTLGSGLRYNMRGSTTWGGGVRSNRVYAGISRSFH